MKLELPTLWRCNGCAKTISTSGTQTAGDMEAFSWRDSTMTHWCVAGSKSSPCTIIVVLDTGLLEGAEKKATPAPIKRGPGRPPKVEAEL